MRHTQTQLFLSGPMSKTIRSGPLCFDKNTLSVARPPFPSLLLLPLLLCQSVAVGGVPLNSTNITHNMDVDGREAPSRSRCASVTQVGVEERGGAGAAVLAAGSYYVPQCGADGTFLPQQCWASSGYCWCVNVLTGAEIPATRTPPGTLPVDCASSSEAYRENDFCPPGWSRFGTRCFVFISTLKTWLEAEAYCVFEGATLASVHSAEENRFLQTLTRGNGHDFPRTWIGGTDAIQNGFWLWSDGSRFDYQNFLRGLTMSSSEPCLEMNVGLSLEWNDLACNNKKPFLCAEDIHSVPPPSTMTTT